MRPLLAVLLVLQVGPLALPAEHNACPSDSSIAAYVSDFAAGRVSAAIPTNLSMLDAECGRAKLVRALPQVAGRLIGYKAGFTNSAVQRRVGVTGPAWGAMFEKFMVPSGATLSTKVGARLQYEADLIVVVSGSGLADARTPLQALSHLSAVVPFLELPDPMVDGPLAGVDAIARNIAFRGGVTGKPVPIAPTQAFLDSLAAMDVVLTDDRTGTELGRAEGRVLMDHPIRAAMWLAQALRADGILLKAGDLLSLGGFIQIAPAQPGLRLTLRYLGLPGTPSVSVQFES